MNVLYEKVYKKSDGYFLVKFYEDGSFEEIPMSEAEALPIIEKQEQEDSLNNRESKKFGFPLGYHEDGRKFTEEEIEAVRKVLYGK